jgi:hypothetical protein
VCCNKRYKHSCFRYSSADVSLNEHRIHAVNLIYEIDTQ